MGFFRQEYWSELPFPSPEDLPDPGIKPTSPVAPALAGGFFTSEPPGKPSLQLPAVFVFLFIFGCFEATQEVVLQTACGLALSVVPW